MKRQLKRLFDWCPEPHTPSYGALRQYSKPIIALLTVSILAVSIIAASFFAFSHFVATAPLVIDQSLPQTSTPTATPTAIPAPSPAAYIQATPTASPAPTPTPQPPTPTNNLNTRPIMIVQNQTITNTTLSQGINNEELYAVVQSHGSLQGNLWLNVRFNALAGYTKSSGARGSDMLLIKTEQTLSSVLMPLFNRMDVYKNSVLWEKTYGGSLDDEAKGIVLSSDGGYILAGYTKSFGAGASDMYLVRTDSNGTMLWNMTYGGAKDDGANSIVRAADGGYVLAGYTNSNVQSQSTWIVKVNASGQMQWNTICDGQAATSIATTSDGGYVLTVEHPNAYGLVKINSIGQVQWNRTYPIPSYSGRAQSVVQDVGGGYAIAGWLKSETGENATWLIKTDSIGTLLWNRTYTGLGTYSMVQTNSGGYALTGDCPILLITDSAGNVIRNQTYGALSDPSIAFTRGYSVIQPATDEYVIAMVELLWTNPSGLQTYIVSVNFRTNL